MVTRSKPRSLASSTAASWMARRVAMRLRSRSPNSLRVDSGATDTSTIISLPAKLHHSSAGLARFGQRALHQVGVDRVVHARVRLVVGGVPFTLVGEQVAVLQFGRKVLRPDV